MSDAFVKNKARKKYGYFKFFINPVRARIKEVGVTCSMGGMKFCYIITVQERHHTLHCTPICTLYRPGDFFLSRSII